MPATRPTLKPLQLQLYFIRRSNPEKKTSIPKLKIPSPVLSSGFCVQAYVSLHTQLDLHPGKPHPSGPNNQVPSRREGPGDPHIASAWKDNSFCKAAPVSLVECDDLLQKCTVDMSRVQGTQPFSQKQKQMRIGLKLHLKSMYYIAQYAPIYPTYSYTPYTPRRHEIQILEICVLRIRCIQGLGFSPNRLATHRVLQLD